MMNYILNDLERQSKKANRNISIISLAVTLLSISSVICLAERFQENDILSKEIDKLTKRVKNLEKEEE